MKVLTASSASSGSQVWRFQGFRKVWDTYLDLRHIQHDRLGHQNHESIAGYMGIQQVHPKPYSTGTSMQKLSCPPFQGTSIFQRTAFGYVVMAMKTTSPHAGVTSTLHGHTFPSSVYSGYWSIVPSCRTFLINLSKVPSTSLPTAEVSPSGRR